MAHETNTPYRSSFGVSVQTNFKLLLAFSFTFIGWIIWPETALGWGWGYLAVCLYLSALGLFIETSRAVIKRFVQERALKKYLAQGNKPQSANLVSDDTMKNSEMIDG